jgi:hypothetical protein
MVPSHLHSCCPNGKRARHAAQEDAVLDPRILSITDDFLVGRICEGEMQGVKAL